jgi:hypothetical protein
MNIPKVAFARARVADQAARLPGGHPRALGQGVDQRGGHVRVGGVVEVLQPLGAGAGGVADQPGLAAGFAVVALDRQQLDQEPLIRDLLAGGRGGDLTVALADGGQPQDPAGLVDRGIGSGVGQLVAGGGPGHHTPAWLAVGWPVSSWS